jgi:acyl phosphate:glycerol-3-phosphate acyltransferase
MLSAIILILVAYLAGSVASAIIVCRLLGLPDPRSDGSGNPGATNVLRIGGKRPAAITLLGDLLKGLLPVLLAQALDASASTIGMVALAAFLGHLYPVFFGFKGGKGLATAFGVVAGMSWLAIAAMAVTWLTVAAITRYSSLSGLIAAVLAPLYLWLITAEAALAVVGILIALLVLVRHEANIRRLLSGTEPKIGQKKPA